jgi:tRNA-dihydrouridine synthase
LRELIEGFGGCDEYFTEMISSGALIGGGHFESWYTDTGPCPEKLVFQLVGADFNHIIRAAALLDRLECRGIDLNMGCSAPLIRKTGAGAAWMASIDRAGELIAGVRKAVTRRLSVKLRIGFQDDFDYLVRFCRRLEAEGVELITLHPRTVREKFRRRARWGYVGQLKKELGIPVAGNGDIANSDELIVRASAQTDGVDLCDALMVGRGAVRRPWIFAEARKIASFDTAPPGAVQSGAGNGGKKFTDTVVEETGVRFLELLSRYQPPEFYISRARRFFAYFCDNLKWGNYLKKLLNREESLDGIERVWRNYFSDQTKAITFNNDNLH